MVYTAIRNSERFQHDYRLRDQSTGAAVSVMGNISEGFVRRSNKEFIKFLFIAVSFAAELLSHMYVAPNQNYIAQSAFGDIYKQAEKTSRMVSGLITCLRNNERRYQQEKQKKPEKPNKPEKR
jgi:four helix bundle protein